jgi:dihydroneopterin aldolase
MDFLIEGLEVYGHHGVPAEERVLGQRLVFSVRLTMDDCQGAHTDEVSDTVDYTEVIDVITEVATVDSYSLLERLAQVTAETILARFPLLQSVRVQVSKPQPPVACALACVAAAVELRRVDLEG